MSTSSRARPQAMRDAAVVPSLATSCLRVLRQRIPTIRDVGSAPFALVAPILLDRMMGVAQMREIEANSPSLLADRAHSNAVWRALAIRSVPTLLDLDHGTDPADVVLADEPPDWRRWLVDAEAAELRRETAARAKLRGKLGALEAGKREAAIQVVDVQQKKRKPSAGPSPPFAGGLR